MNIRYPIYEGVYRILTNKRKNSRKTNVDITLFGRKNQSVCRAVVLT